MGSFTSKRISRPQITTYSKLYAIEFISDETKQRKQQELTRNLTNIIQSMLPEISINRYIIELKRLEQEIQNLKNVFEYICDNKDIECTALYRKQSSMPSFNINMLKNGIDDLISENCLPGAQDKCLMGAIPELKNKLEDIKNINFENRDEFAKEMYRIRDSIIMIYAKYTMLNNSIANIKEDIDKVKIKIKGGESEKEFSKYFNSMFIVGAIVVFIIIIIILLVYYFTSVEGMNEQQKIESSFYKNNSSNLNNKLISYYF
jgi:hypothetical protein